MPPPHPGADRRAGSFDLLAPASKSGQPRYEEPAVPAALKRFHVEPFSINFREVDDKSMKIICSEKPYSGGGGFKRERQDVKR